MYLVGCYSFLILILLKKTIYKYSLLCLRFCLHQNEVEVAIAIQPFVSDIFSVTYRRVLKLIKNTKNNKRIIAEILSIQA